jgi:hypothetical protein
MTADEDGRTIDQSEAPGPARDDGERDHNGITGDSAVEGGNPPPGDRDGARPADEPDPIDLDTVRDRAS